MQYFRPNSGDSSGEEAETGGLVQQEDGEGGGGGEGLEPPSLLLEWLRLNAAWIHLS